MVALLLSSLLWAQDITLSLSSDRIARGQITDLSIDFVNIDEEKAPFFPKGGGLSIELQNPSPEKTFLYANGRVERVLRYQYKVLGIAEGDWSLGPVSITYKGRSVVSNRLSIEVISPSGSEATTKNKVEGSIDKDVLYVGEVASYHVYYELRDTGVGNELIPSTLTGLKALSRVPPQEKKSHIWEDTKMVEVTDVWYPIQAQNESRYEISPAKVRVSHIIPNDDEQLVAIFQKKYREQFFVASELLGVIRPLPPPPSGFSGLVGQFFFRVYSKKRVMEQGSPVQLVMEIWGNGVVQGGTLPSFSSDDFEVFDEEPTIEESFVDGVYTSKMTMIRTLLPLGGGKYTIAPFSLTTFDPVQERYVQLQSDPIIIQVQGEPVKAKDREKIDEPQIPAWVERLPVSKSVPILPWWITWVMAIFPLFRLVFRKKQTTSPPSIPSVLPTDPQERLVILSQVLHDFLFYVEHHDVLYDQDKLLAAQESLYLVRYGGATVEGVEELIRSAMVLR